MDSSANKFDIAVIGGGASGLMAALSAAMYLKSNGQTARIAILEACDKVGKKLLATGNGRCNFTNRNIDASTDDKVRDLTLKRFHSVENIKGQPGELAVSVISQFGYRDTISFFESLGLVTVSDDAGRLYPYSQLSSSVLDLLRLELEAHRVHELCYYPIDKLEYKDGMWLMHSGDMLTCAKKVILATGGMASPSWNNGTSGYALLKKLGLKMTATYPALTQIKCDSKSMAALKGIRHASKVAIIADGRIVKTERGELQFSDSALSGICIFELSRLVSEFFTCGTVDGKKVSSIEVSVDLMPSLSVSQLERELLRRISAHGSMPIEKLFTGILHKNLGQAVIKSVYEGSLNRPCEALDEKIAEKLAYSAKNLRFKPSKVSPWQSAQVTAGGLSASELDPVSLETRLKGLFVSGELIDIDGDCGGYNLQWAWSSGYIAGNSAARSLTDDSYDNVIVDINTESEKKAKKEKKASGSSAQAAKHSNKKHTAKSTSSHKKHTPEKKKEATKKAVKEEKAHVPVAPPKAKPIPISTIKTATSERRKSSRRNGVK